MWPRVSWRLQSAVQTPVRTEERVDSSRPLGKKCVAADMASADHTAASVSKNTPGAQDKHTAECFCLFSELIVCFHKAVLLRVGHVCVFLTMCVYVCVWFD